MRNKLLNLVDVRTSDYSYFFNYFIGNKLHHRVMLHVSVFFKLKWINNVVADIAGGKEAEGV